MDWNRSQTLALAGYHCVHCHGVGTVQGRNGEDTPCNCVFRGIFRACYTRFRECLEKDKHIPQANLERGSGASGRRYFWSRKEEEYVADFHLVSKRALTSPGSGNDYEIFRFHYLLGADWRMCCRRLNIDKGRFYHRIYRIEEKLGRIYRELQPYALYPLDEYFTTGARLSAAEIKPRDDFHRLFGKAA